MSIFWFLVNLVGCRYLSSGLECNFFNLKNIPKLPFIIYFEPDTVEYFTYIILFKYDQNILCYY